MRRRARWFWLQRRIDPAVVKRMVFIDETWAKTNMTRTHGWGNRGHPLVAKVPHGHWKTLTFIAGLKHDGIVAPCVIDGPINGESFTAWIEQFLIPELEPGSIVVIDKDGAACKRYARAVDGSLGGYTALASRGGEVYFLTQNKFGRFKALSAE